MSRAHWTLITLIGAMIVTAISIPRGVRNNNPVNIRISDANDWKGELPGALNKAADGEFETFYSPVSGFRAGAVLLRNYARAGHRTIAQIITRFAPPSENPTAAYIEFVASELATSPAEVLALDDDDLLADLLLAMSVKENGRFLGLNWYTRAMALAGVKQA